MTANSLFKGNSIISTAVGPEGRNAENRGSMSNLYQKKLLDLSQLTPSQHQPLTEVNRDIALQVVQNQQNQGALVSSEDT